MDNYKLRKRDGDTLECDRCGSPAPTVEHRWDDIGRTRPIDPDRAPKELLCMFCYETHFGSILQYDHHRDEQSIARAMCQSLNLMMERLKPPHGPVTVSDNEQQDGYLASESIG